MALTTYVYSIAADFPSGKVDAGALQEEIGASAITIAIDGIDTNGDVCNIVFKDALPAADKTVLDNDTTAPSGGLLAAHTGIPLPDPLTASGVPLVSIDGPVSSDGKPIFLSNMFRGDVNISFTGCGDDVTNGTRWGPAISVTFPANHTPSPDTKIEEFQFIEWVYLAGGMLHVMNGEASDMLDYDLVAPATVGTNNVGTGAYDKTDVGGGLNMYTPNATTTGDWDLNLTETLNANVGFTKVVPVPSETETGFFNWNTKTEAVTFNAEQKGKYNLFDAEIVLGRFISKLNIMGSHMHELRIPNVKPKRILAQWIHRLRITHTDEALKMHVAPVLLIARKSTAP